MAFKKVLNMDTDTTVALGGKNESGQPNPTKIEGYYLGYREVDSDYGVSKLHIFQTSKGNIGVWGKTRLDSKLSASLVGTMLLVTFTGMIPSKKKGRKPAYGYEVQYDDANKIDVVSLVEAASDVADAEDDYEEEMGNDGDPVQEEGYDEPAEETDPGEEAPFPDEAPPARARPPRQAAAAPSADRQRKVKDLLAGRKQTA